MATVTNTAQLSLFSTIRSALRTNATISAQFKESDFYEFEPNLKSMLSAVPYIVINYPDLNDTELIVFNHETTTKKYSIEILLVIDYLARSKYPTFMNAIIYQLEASTSTFEALGLYNLKVENSKPTIDIIEQKQLVVGSISLEFDAVVLR